jgi:diguanylate cyclase (GGDEF)-like protein
MGDEVLRSVTDRIFRCLEPTDAAFRFGGDELLLALEGREAPAAYELAERVCRAIGRTPAWTTTPSVTVTVSVGTASLRPGESKDELVRRAETAIADAKRGGGNVVAVAKG